MGRPPYIIEKLNTEYFENVSPIWTQPEIRSDGLLRELWQHMPNGQTLSVSSRDKQKASKSLLMAALKAGGYSESRINEIWIEEIDSRYHAAAFELARWRPEIDGWDCAGWATHSDNIFFAVRTELIATCEAWRGYDWAAFEREYERLKEYWNDGPVWIKEFQWRAIPSELPPRATLIGLCLADVVAQFGNGRAAQVVRHSPIKFDIINQTPWKAILEFIGVVFEEKDLPDNAAIRRSITYHAPKILQFYRTPHNIKY